MSNIFDDINEMTNQLRNQFEKNKQVVELVGEFGTIMQKLHDHPDRELVNTVTESLKEVFRNTNITLNTNQNNN